MKYKLYEVGGKIRDELLGLESKDVDYSVVITQTNTKNPEVAFRLLATKLKQEGYKIFQETIDCYTIRALFPKNHEHEGVADFVMARKEVDYIKNTRKPILEIGNLYDDLERRDFTVNAIAKDIETGEIIDPFNGQADLKEMMLKCPINPMKSLSDDPLRILRAFRFAVTKGFSIDDDVMKVIQNFDVSKMSVVSTERIVVELTKCFKYDTHETLVILNVIREVNRELYNYILKCGFWLEPTTKKK